MDPKAIVFWSNVRTADFIISRVSTVPLAFKGTSISGQKQLISGTTHCFFAGVSIITGSLCLFPSDDDGDGDGDDDDDGCGAGDGDVFLSQVAFFHKLFTFSTSVCRRQN